MLLVIACDEADDQSACQLLLVNREANCVLRNDCIALPEIVLALALVGLKPNVVWKALSTALFALEVVVEK